MIITLTSFKGGTGKTTSAIHIAAYFSQFSDVLLVDGDPNRSSLGWSERGELPFKVCDEKAALKHSSKYKNIVVDTKAFPEPEDLKALAEGCDLLIVPSTPDALSLDSLMKIVDVLDDINDVNYGVLLTRIPPKPRRDGEEARKLLDEAEIPTFSSQIREAVAFQKASLKGCLVSNSGDSRGKTCWGDYKKLGDEIRNEFGE